MPICHTGKAGIAGNCLLASDFCGKFGTFALFATRKLCLCGKPVWEWPVCHTEKAGTARSRLVDVDFYGKLGADASFATRK